MHVNRRMIGGETFNDLICKLSREHYLHLVRRNLNLDGIMLMTNAKEMLII